MIRTADLLAETLAAHGVTHAFGMPGGEVVTVLDALVAAGIRFTLARNETAAAMMAAGVATVTGGPGLLVTTLGPGLANAVNGIADAAQERTPLVVLSGAVERRLRGRYTHQILDHRTLLAPLVKASFEIDGPADAAAVAARAVRLAMTPPCGPVHIDVAPDVAAVAGVAGRLAEPAPRRDAGVDPAAPAIAELAAALAGARRPIILAGLEAARTGAAPALRALEAAGVPVLTTYKAKGVVDENRPRALGAAGLSPKADAILKPLFAAADLVVLAGYDPIEMRPGWIDPFGTARVIELSAAPPDHGMHAVDLVILGPVDGVLAAVAGAVAPDGWPDGAPEAAKAMLAAAFAEPAEWGPGAVFAALSRGLAGSGATVTVDSGAHRILLSQGFAADRPLSMLQSAGWCTMGSALPLAIGAKLADPSRPVVAVLGDGGLEMTFGELATLRDLGLPVVVLVVQDESLALIELKQAAQGLKRAGVGLGRTLFEDAARAFGGHGVRVSDRAGLADALAAALAADRFTVIVAEVAAKDYVDAF